MTIDGIAQCFFTSDLSWFITAYIGLYILSPVLNTFIEHVNRRSYEILLVALLIFQLLYDGKASTFNGGYSVLFFMELYLLARYVRVCQSFVSNQRMYVYLIVYLICAIILTICNTISGIRGVTIPIVGGIAYSNPVVIIESLALLLLFSKINFSSKMVNWLGASSFAVYLVHLNPNIVHTYFIPIVRRLASNSNLSLGIAGVFAFLIIVFTVSVLYDQIRIFSWNRVQKLIFKK